jgi:hypothetical protein
MATAGMARSTGERTSAPNCRQRADLHITAFTV